MKKSVILAALVSLTTTFGVAHAQTTYTINRAIGAGDSTYNWSDAIWSTTGISGPFTSSWANGDGTNIAIFDYYDQVDPPSRGLGTTINLTSNLEIGELIMQKTSVSGSALNATLTLQAASYVALDLNKITLNQGGGFYPEIRINVTNINISDNLTFGGTGGTVLYFTAADKTIVQPVEGHIKMEGNASLRFENESAAAISRKTQITIISNSSSLNLGTNPIVEMGNLYGTGGDCAFTITGSAAQASSNPVFSVYQTTNSVFGGHIQSNNQNVTFEKNGPASLTLRPSWTNNDTKVPFRGFAKILVSEGTLEIETRNTGISDTPQFFAGNVQINEGGVLLFSGNGTGNSKITPSSYTFEVTNMGCGVFNMTADYGYNFSGTIYFDLDAVTLSSGDPWWTLINWTGANGTFAPSAVKAGDMDFSLSGNLWSATIGERAWTFDQSLGLISFTAIPEPASLALLVLGSFAALALRRKRKL